MKSSRIELFPAPESLVDIGSAAADSHGDGLGFMRQGGEDDARLEWNAVDGGQGQ